MASYTVPAGHVGAHDKTLVASTVDTITFEVGSTSQPGWGKLPQRVEVLTDGSYDIYLTLDGTAPTVGGTHCWRIPALAGATVVDVRDSNPSDAVVIKMISAGTPRYSVSRA